MNAWFPPMPALAPTTADALAWPTSGPVAFAPPFVWGFQTWHVNLYQPPTSEAQAALWSEVHLHCLAATKPVASKILPHGRRHGRLFRAESADVALKRSLVPEIGQVLERGEWVCWLSGARGRNLVELYAHLHRRSYQDAVLAIADAAGLVGADGCVLPRRRTWRWCQELHPLHADLGAALLPPEYPAASTGLLYRNRAGHPIVQVIGWRGSDGRLVRVYRSLWRHASSPESQWVEVSPQEPYPLFNMDQLACDRDRPVVLAEDELMAADYTWRCPEHVVSTVPGGLENLPRADLEPLRGRTVGVILGQDDVRWGLRIRAALLKAGSVPTVFSLDHGWSWRPFETLEVAAAERGMAMLPPPVETERVDRATVVISSAGEAILGGDTVRRLLLEPIVREGGLIWLYAEPKIGKTWLGLAIAHAVASADGRVGPWRSPEPHRVLYVDGEMMPDELSASIRMVMAGAGEPSDVPSFATLCAQCQPDGVVDLTEERWRETIEALAKDTKLVILDNFQSLTDNGPGALKLLLPLLRGLKRSGIAVLVLDHTNRDGDLQGSAAKERFADLSIALRYPDGQAKEEGRILVEFPVSRRLHGDDVRPFQLRKVFTEETFSLAAVEPSREEPQVANERIREMALMVYARDIEGLPYARIEEEYGVARGTAFGRRKKALELKGDEKAALEAEVERLKAERARDDS